ncbi:hypothetical protein BGX26_006357 [Mortierella sp. AD094]|nr:hypothetical protein BGX26_006357 [Mortierella sp. AD094]
MSLPNDDQETVSLEDLNESQKDKLHPKRLVSNLPLANNTYIIVQLPPQGPSPSTEQPSASMDLVRD